MQTIPLAKICPVKTKFEQLISDEHPHSYILTPYFGIGIMRNLQMAMQLCISVLFIDKWLCNFTFRFCSSTKWLCNFTFRFCSSTKWLCNFAMRSADFACYRYQLQLLFFSQSRISTIFALGRFSWQMKNNDWFSLKKDRLWYLARKHSDGTDRKIP